MTSRSHARRDHKSGDPGTTRHADPRHHAKWARATFSWPWTDRRLKQALVPPVGAAAPELGRLREALVRVDRPDLTLDWLKTPGVRPFSSPSRAAVPSPTRRSMRCPKAALSLTSGQCS